MALHLTSFLPRDSDGHPDWSAVREQLARLEGDQLEDLVDAAVDEARDDQADLEACAVLITALNRVQSAFGKRNTALALARIAPADHEDTLDALTDAYRQHRLDTFLAPVLLKALGLLALSSDSARAQVTAFLHRLKPSHDRYELLTAARLIGHLDALERDAGLRNKLETFAQADDLLVQAEATHQLALLHLGDALRTTDERGLLIHLQAAAAGFARAQQLEEQRPDAALLAGLVSALLAFLDVATNPAGAAEKLHVLHIQLDTTWRTVTVHDVGYASPLQRRLVSWVLRVTAALRTAADAATDWESWLDRILVDLAQGYARIRADVTALAEAGQVPRAVPDLADRVYAASLGPVLRRAVTLQRLSRLRLEESEARGESGVTRGLEALEAAARAAPHLEPPPQDPQIQAKFAELAAKHGWSSEVLWEKFTDALRHGSVDHFIQQLHLTTPLPFPHEGPLGGLLDVDEVVRPVILQAAHVLQSYPPERWTRLLEVLVEIVRFVQDERERLPDYMRSAEDGGKGRDAKEEDLQHALWQRLRDRFGRIVENERTPFGGGRVDLCVTFPDGQFPIEVKREFKNVSREHVREVYLFQADRYAATAHRVAFLMVLDLRHHGPRKRRRNDPPADPTPPPGLYTLPQSFYVEALPADEQVQGMQPNAVIVGLVPGNLPRPSTMSQYSSAGRTDPPR